jgi:hypothetical protein
MNDSLASTQIDSDYTILQKGHSEGYSADE